MTIASIIADIEAEAKIWAPKVLTFLEGIAITETQKAVAVLKQTSVGTAVANLVSSLQYSTLSGTDKFEHVVLAAEGVYEAFVGAGGLNGLLTVGVSVLRQLIQSTFDDIAVASAPARLAPLSATSSLVANSAGVAQSI